MDHDYDNQSDAHAWAASAEADAGYDRRDRHFKDPNLKTEADRGSTWLRQHSSTSAARNVISGQHRHRSATHNNGHSILTISTKQHQHHRQQTACSGLELCVAARPPSVSPTSLSQEQEAPSDGDRTYSPDLNLERMDRACAAWAASAEADAGFDRGDDHSKDPEKLKRTVL